MSRKWFTVGFSAHRVETLATAEEAMAGHQVVALEEPPTPGFEDMLAGRVGIDEHLERMAPEFPEYSRHQCTMLRRLHDLGARIVQVEPFLAELEAIHSSFEAGGRPEDLEGDATRWQVYQAEKRWTGALLGFYAASASADFDRVVDAVRAFARADATRGLLRDAMRAERLAGLPTTGGLYVEAGYVHAGLIGELRRRVPSGVPVRPLWLMAPAAAELGGPAFSLAPGDRLTLALTCGKALDRSDERLLAARSLIQVAISVKEELLPTTDRPFPHTLDELRSSRLVEDLGYEDCRLLYPKVRSLPPRESRSLVQGHTAAL